MTFLKSFDSVTWKHRRRNSVLGFHESLVLVPFRGASLLRITLDVHERFDHTVFTAYGQIEGDAS